MKPMRIKARLNSASTRRYPGADRDSNHDLVQLIMKFMVKKKFQAAYPCFKFVLEKLRSLKVNEIFQAKLGGRSSALNVLDKNDRTDSIGEAFFEKRINYFIVR